MQLQDLATRDDEIVHLLQIPNTNIYVNRLNCIHIAYII